MTKQTIATHHLDLAREVAAPVETQEPDALGTDSRRWYVLAVFTAIYTFHAVDRQLISIVLEPIKKAFALSDIALGVLAGTVYAVSFSLAGIPTGMLVDRVNRRNLLAGAVALWSSATALSGIATSYVYLVMARIGLAVCEAPSLPASVSMLSDLFHRRQRATALGIYTMGLGIGQLVGFVFGGYIAANWGWRHVFFIGGLPGLALAAILVATVKEPARRSSTGELEARANIPSPLVSLKFVASQPSLIRFFVSYVLVVLATSALMTFLPSFYVRTHGISLQKAGLLIGVGFGVATTAGSLLGGVIADRLARRNIALVPRFGAASAVIIAAACSGMVLVPSVPVAAALMICWGLAFTAQIAPYYSLSQSLVGTRMRGTTVGLLNTLVNVIAYGLGAPLAGGLSDLYGRWAGNDALRYALLSVTALNLLAAWSYTRIERTLLADLERAKDL